MSKLTKDSGGLEQPVQPPIRESLPGRVRIVAAALALSALVIAVLVVWRPGPDRNDFSYAAVARARDAFWASAVADGIALVVVAVALGLAGCLLAPRRGAHWATTGAVVSILGGAAFAAGVTSYAVLGWYATAAPAVSVDEGMRLMEHVENDFSHVGALIMPGFLLFTVGSLLVAVALWRSRSVPRWWPIAFMVLTLLLFVDMPVSLKDAVQGTQMLSLLVVAVVLWRGANRR